MTVSLIKDPLRRGQPLLKKTVHNVRNFSNILEENSLSIVGKMGKMNGLLFKSPLYFQNMTHFS